MARSTTSKKTSKRPTRKAPAAAGRTRSKSTAKKKTKKKTTKRTTKKTRAAAVGKKTASRKKTAKRAVTRKTTKKRAKVTKKATSQPRKKTTKKAAASKKKTAAPKKAAPRKKKAATKATVAKTRKPQKSTTKPTKKAQEAQAGPSLRQLSQVTSRAGASPALLSSPTSQQLHTEAAATHASEHVHDTPEKPLLKTRRMPMRERQRFRKLLLGKRAELAGDMTTMEADALKVGSSGDLSHTPQHMADQGTDHFEQELTLGLVEFERRLLAEIDEAIRRIEDGTYGICQLTGGPISKSRLEAKPWAKYCIEAARELEQSGRR
ncbi:MAG: TraR/DksA C4-type zinc finger protein [Phycisphaerales bacterium]|nr:TraR/DksA C4-type zinc finger protein [Phycisphaerales bacterium]